MKNKDTKNIPEHTPIEDLTAAFRAHMSSHLDAVHTSSAVSSRMPYIEPHTGTFYKDDVYVGGISVYKALTQIDFICKQLKKDAPVTNLETVQHMNSKELATFIVTEAKKCISGIGDPVQELIEWLESPA